MARQKVTVNTDPVANSQRNPMDRIIEFSSPNGGGLISFRMDDDGGLRLDPYRLDPTVRVNPNPENLTDASVGRLLRHLADEVGLWGEPTNINKTRVEILTGLADEIDPRN